VDISNLKDGEKLTVEWRGKPVWIIKRTPEQLKDCLASMANWPTRSARHPEEFTPPMRKTKRAPSSLKSWWSWASAPTWAARPPTSSAGPSLRCPRLEGRLPVPLPRLDLRHGRPRVQEQAGAGQPAVPPHMYLSDTKLLIGEDKKA
jgi:ubiquinol-cytochrome c reductase iron-sulfur subunit